MAKVTHYATEFLNSEKPYEVNALNIAAHKGYKFCGMVNECTILVSKELDTYSAEYTELYYTPHKFNEDMQVEKGDRWIQNGIVYTFAGARLGGDGLFNYFDSTGNLNERVVRISLTESSEIDLIYKKKKEYNL